MYFRFIQGAAVIWVIFRFILMVLASVFFGIFEGYFDNHGGCLQCYCEDHGG